MVTKEKNVAETEEVNPLDITEPDVTFDAQIVSFKLEEGVALFEFTTEDTDQTYVSTMNATFSMEGKSEFEEFLEQNGIERTDDAFDDLPVDCEVVTQREDDVMKFEIKSVNVGEEEVTFEEITSFGVGAVAGLAPVSNVLFFTTMLLHTMSKDETTNSDVTFLFGTFMSMVASFIIVFPFLF